VQPVVSKVKQSGPVTLRQIAELAGTSKSTVSRVLSHHPKISAATRDRVMAIIEQRGFRPNVFARALAGGRTGQIGVLSSNISSGFFAEVIRGIDLVAQEAGGHLVCSFAHGIPDYLALWRELTEGGQVDGLILIDPPLELFDEVPGPRRLPTVLCASRPPARARAWQRVASVTVDNGTTMRSVVDHVVGLGCRRLLHLAGPDNTFDSQQRAAAFQAAVKGRRGLEAGLRHGHLTQETGRATAELLLAGTDDLPDAIVAFNDSTALGVMAALRRHDTAGRRPPALTGWDDTPAADVLGLTSVRMPMTELGQASARLLYQQLESDPGAPPAGAHQQLPMTLIPRASSTDWTAPGQAR
jgi:DNA-binding LacI/PurR family transcriptional regulator